MPASARVSTRYLLQEAALFLGLSYIVLLGGRLLVWYRFMLLDTLLVTGLGAGWLIWRWRRQPLCPVTRLDVPLLAWSAACILATLTSQDPRRSAGLLCLVGIYVLVFYLVIDLRRAGWPADLFPKTLIFVGSFILVAGLWELTGWYTTWLSLSGGGPELIPAATTRLRSFLVHPNLLAAFLNIVLPAGIISAISAQSAFKRLAWGAWSAGILILLYFSSSRGGWLGAASGLGTLVILLIIDRKPNWRQGLGQIWRNKLIAAMLLTISVAGLIVIGYLFYWQAQHPTHGDRESIWVVAWDMVWRHPLTGNGPFTFSTEYIAHYSVPPTPILTHAHNLLFNIAAETGLVGLAAFIAVGLAWLISAYRRWQTASSEERRWLMTALSGLAGVAIHSLFDTPQTMPGLSILMVMLAALAVAGEKTTVLDTRVVKPKPTPLVRNGILTALWLAVSAGMWWGLWGYYPFTEGVLAGNLGLWKNAVPLLDEATQRDPGHNFYWLQDGYAHGHLALTETGAVANPAELAPAIAAYERGVKGEPYFATNWANLGILQWANGDQTKALDSLKHASQAAAGQTAYRLTLARMYEMSGQTDAARAEYEAVLSQRADWGKSYFFRATPFRQQVYAAWVSASAQETQLQDPGWAALAANQPDKARAYFEQARGLNTPDAYLGLGLADLADKQYASAEHYLRIAQFMPTNSEGQPIQIQLALGEAYVRQGKYPAAIPVYEAMLNTLAKVTSFGVGKGFGYGWDIFGCESLWPDLLPGLDYILYTDEVVNGMLLLGDSYRASGNPAAAEQMYRQAVTAAPDNTAAQARLAEITAR